MRLIFKLFAYCPLSFATGCGFGTALGAAVPGGWAAWRVGVVMGLALAAGVGLATTINHLDNPYQDC